MKTALIFNDLGWMDGMVTSDFLDPKHYPDKVLVEVSPEISKSLSPVSPLVRLENNNITLISSQEDVWNRLRMGGLQGTDCKRIYQEIMDLIPNSLQLQKASIKIDPQSLSFVRVFPPVFQTEIQPGLLYRLSGPDDVSVWVDRMNDSGLYQGKDIWLEVMSWLSDVYSWPIATEFKGEVLQLEMYHFGRTDRNQVLGGFATHVDRLRPRWFWAKTAKALFEAFDSIGVATLEAAFRSDRTDWISILQSQYGAKILSSSADSKFITLKYSLQAAYDKTKDLTFPSKVSLPGWSYKGKDISIREASSEDIPKLKDWIKTNPGIMADPKTSDQEVDKYLELDSSTALIVSKSGESDIVDVWFVRERREKQAHQIMCMSKKDPELMNDITTGVLKWVKDSGYSSCVMFLQKAWMGTGVFEAVLKSSLWKTAATHRDGTVTEYEADL